MLKERVRDSYVEAVTDGGWREELWEKITPRIRRAVVPGMSPFLLQHGPHISPIQ